LNKKQEMRQFTEFGVSLPDLLAEKYTKAEGRIVTAGDVIERVSKRMVSFNDVKDVLWQSTDKGGKFYGMQNVLAQSTSGMASNLKDAIDTMYYDIAKSNSGMIKGTIKNITELVSHWRELTSVLSAGTIVYGAYRLIIAAHNRMIGMNTAETLKGVMAAKQEEASLLRRKALNEGLTEEEQRRLATSKKITASDVQSMAANKMINSDQLMRLVNSGRISPEMAASSAKMVGLNKVGRDYLATLIRLDRGISQNALSWRMFTSVFSNAADMNTLKINLLSRAQKAWLTGTRLLGDALSSLGSMFATILSPANIGMAGISLALSSIIDYNQRISQLKDANKQMIKDAEDSSKSIGKFLDENSIADISKKGASDIDNMVEEYRKQLEESPLDMSHFLANVDTIDNATEKLTAMREELEKIKKVDDDVSKNGNPFMASAQSMEHLLSDWMIGLEDKIVPIINLAKDKTLNGLFNDLESGAAKVNRAMADVTSSQLTEAIKNIKKESPDAAKELDALASSGANADEIVRRLIETGHSDAIVGIFGNLSVSDIGNYSRSLDNVKSKINDVIDGLGSKFKGINTGTATEEEVMEFKKLADGIAKSMNLSGNSLDLWNSKIEEMTSHSDKNLKYETYSWKVFTDNIKSIAEKKGIDLNKASQRQWLELVNDAKRQCGVLYPWMSNFLQSLISMANNNPIQFVIGIKSQVTGRQPLKGRGKQLAGNFAVSSLLGYDKLSTIQTDKDASDLVKSTYETYQEDMKNAKANRKSTKDIQAKWNQFKEIMSSEMNVDFIIGGEKIGGKKGHTGTGGGTKTDTFLKDMQDKLDQVKKAMDVYKKWKDTGLSESLSIEKMDASGIFAKGTFKNISSENGLNDWYKKTLENLSNAVKKAKYTAERKKYTDSIAELFGEFDQKATKDKFDEYGKYVDKLISDTKTKWDNYQKLLSAGSNRTDAANFAFGGKSPYGSLSEAMASNFYNELAKNNIRKNIDFGMKEEDVKKLLGDGKIAEEMLKLWKDAKEQIEKDRIDIQINADKAKEQISSISDKIKSSIEKALDQSLGINISSGKQTRLSEVSSIDKNTGLLKLDENAKDVLSPSQIEDAKNLIESENQEITKLGSQLLELLPAWDDIFGKSAYMSLEQLLRGMREAKEIVENAKIVNDKNGKPSYFTSTYKDKDGNTQSVSGNIGELDRLRNQEDTRQGDINKKNPFVGMYKSLGNYFGAKKEQKKWENISRQAEKNGGTTTYTDKNGNKQTITAKDAKTKANDAQDEASRSALSFSEAMQSAIGEMQKWNNALSLLGSTIEALGGGTGVSDAAGVAGGMLSGAMSMSSLGPWGMAAGAAMGAITGIAGLHDKKLDRAIEKSKQKVQELQLAYKSIEDSMKYALGNQATNSDIETPELRSLREARKTKEQLRNKGKLSIFDLRNLQNAQKIINNTSDATKNYERTGNAYQYQLDLYKQQLTEVEKQRQDEEDKKNTDQSKINDYNSQIEELQTKITQYWQDLASQVYGIDLKSWASQFGDALYDAWQKGEDGATSFDTTAQKVISDVVKKMLDLNVIEPMLKDMQTYLFGKNGVLTDGDLSTSDLSGIMGYIAKIKDSTDTAYTYLDQIDEAYKEKYGESLKTNTSSSSANAISGVSEQEANIIAAYMDAIRQDTYNNRMNIQKIVESSVKIESSPMMQAQLLQLQQIQSNTYRNMELVGDIKSLLTDFSLGNKKIYVN
jgi:hypothetical protein